jgi:hypothetical protein
MQRYSRRKYIWTTAGVLALIGAGFVGYNWVLWIIANDPFMKYRLTGTDDPRMQIALTIKDVQFRYYELDKIQAEWQIGRVDIRRDRRLFLIEDIRDGVFHAEGRTVRFSATQASWDNGLRALNVTRGAKVSTDDAELQTPNFTYFEGSRVINMPGVVQGKILGGDFEAKSVTLNLADQSIDTGEIGWRGMLTAQNMGLPVENAGRGWDVKAKRASMKGDIQTLIDGEATDGEVLVRSPRIERNLRTDVITAFGPVEYYGLEANATCDRVVVYRNERRAVLTGNVQLLLKPENTRQLEPVPLQPFRPPVPDEIAQGRPIPPPGGRSQQDKDLDEALRNPETARRYPVVAYGDRVEYWYAKGQRRAVITGSPQARQEMPGGRWRHLWAYRAVWNGQKNTILLESQKDRREVRVRNSLGDDLVARWFLASTREGDDSWEAEDIGGVVFPNEEDVPPEETRPPGSNLPPPNLRGPINPRVRV